MKYKMLCRFIPQDVALLAGKLPNLVDKFEVTLRRLNHFDFIYAKHIRQLVYDRLIERIESFTPVTNWAHRTCSGLWNCLRNYYLRTIWKPIFPDRRNRSISRSSIAIFRCNKARYEEKNKTFLSLLDAFAIWILSVNNCVLDARGHLCHRWSHLVAYMLHIFFYIVYSFSCLHVIDLLFV